VSRHRHEWVISRAAIAALMPAELTGTTQPSSRLIAKEKHAMSQPETADVRTFYWKFSLLTTVAVFGYDTSA
jgi:hypothetical protein